MYFLNDLIFLYKVFFPNYAGKIIFIIASHIIHNFEGYGNMLQEEYRSIAAYLRTGEFPKQVSSSVSNFKRKANKFELRQDKLYRDAKPVVQFSGQRKLFDQFHTLVNSIIGASVGTPAEIHSWSSRYVPNLNVNV